MGCWGGQPARGVWINRGPLDVPYSGPGRQKGPAADKLSSSVTTERFSSHFLREREIGAFEFQNKLHMTFVRQTHGWMYFPFIIHTESRLVVAACSSVYCGNGGEGLVTGSPPQLRQRSPVYRGNSREGQLQDVSFRLVCTLIGS